MTSTARRLCILTDGHLDTFTAKTATGLLRYCPQEVVAVIDSAHAGERLVDVLGIDVPVPIVSDLTGALVHAPTHLVIGVALTGGRLPAAWRALIGEALAGGMNVINGLHTRLAEDADLAAMAARSAAVIWDVRKPPADLLVGAGRANETEGRRILTVGTDCNLGKRVTALALVSELQRRGRRVAFVPTGQTGVMIAGRGVVIDAVPADFIAGAVEQAILEVADAEFIVVEGQGSLIHPGFSGVTLGLLHGALPDEIICCHAPGRQQMRHTRVNVMEPDAMLALTLAVLAPIHRCAALGWALNCHGMTAAQAEQALSAHAGRTSLPVVDPVRGGVGPLADALLAGR